MSNMFDKYTVTTEQPCNLNKEHVNRSCKKPYEEYNAEGELVGYYWYYGDTVTLQFEITGEVTIDNSAILYTARGECPTNSTLGEVGQKAYNITDMKSWTCTAIVVEGNSNEYIWAEDEKFEYPSNGGKSVYISASQYLADKKVRIELFNFRHEKLMEQTMEAKPTVNFNINSDMSAKLLRGVYYCCVSVLSNESTTYLNHLGDDAIVLNVK